MKLTPSIVDAAAALVAAVHHDNKSLQRALSRAASRLPACEWDVDGGVLKVPSWSTPGAYHYVDHDGCDCPAVHGVCWHKAAYLCVSVVAAASEPIRYREKVTVTPPDYTIEEYWSNDDWKAEDYF